MANKDKNQASYCKSTFTLSFVVELIGIEVWHDCNEGFIDLGPTAQGFKIQYQLYPGQNFELNLLVWPHVVKIWCGIQSSWVRTWQFLERRWLAFSIEHAFPVRVYDLRNFVSAVSVTFGMGSLSSNAKSDKNSEVFIPPLMFGESRHFAPIVQNEQSLSEFVRDLFWLPILNYIPESYLDGPFDCPHPVQDVRHQDRIIDSVRDFILNQNKPPEDDEEILAPPPPKSAKDKGKVEPKAKFEIKLPGDSLLAGAGRVTPYVPFGDHPPEYGEVMVFISSSYLPAPDDIPIFFVNIDNLFNAPVQSFLDAGITHLYTQWRCGEEVHKSQPFPLGPKTQDILFNDHYPVPLPYDIGSAIIATFLDNHFPIELRGVRDVDPKENGAKLFGYDKNDRLFDKSIPPKTIVPEPDIIIAHCKINLKSLSKGISGFVNGEYALYPPKSSIVPSCRELFCTNDVNSIKGSVKPEFIIPISVVLEAQMTLEASLGLVGCTHRKLQSAFSRLYSSITDNDAAMSILSLVTNINDDLVLQGMKNNVLTGWLVDTGDVSLLYVEGPRDRQMMSVWEHTGDFKSVKTVYATAAKFSSRIYPEFLQAAVPFLVLKMFVPLTILLACPPVYARPALPLPAKSKKCSRFTYQKHEEKHTLYQMVINNFISLNPLSSIQAVLKLGSIIESGLESAPPCEEMPTVGELRSLRLELCTPKRPDTSTAATPSLLNKMMPINFHAQTTTAYGNAACNKLRINWGS